MSTKGKEYELAVRIAGKIDKSFNASLATANASLKTQLKSIDNTFTKMDKGYDKIMKAGTKAFKLVAEAAGVAALAVGAATGAAIVCGVQFESAFAGVKKTVDATDQEYAKLRDNILDMSKRIPSSATEIAGVMEVAGQLGIATDNLTDFTEVMINLGVSTNMSAEEAATALAKFANITQMDPSDYEKLGSVIVDLGNNFATTEEDIVNMATNLASTGELVGLSEPQIMALSTAMSSVGIAAEKGGSTMSKLLKKMQIAVETNSGSLADYAKVANMTGDQFKQTFKEDAVKALAAFIDGLNDTERTGKSAVVTLNDMKLNEVRLSNTILALANSGDLMTNAINTANDAWNENTALAVEAGKRYETTESKLQILRNGFFDLGVAAYDDLETPFREVIDFLTNKVSNFTEYLTGPKGLSEWLTNIPTYIRKVKQFGKTTMSFMDPFIDGAKWLGKHPDVLASVFIGLGIALATYKTASTVSHIVQGIMTLCADPTMLAIAGVAAAIGLIAGGIAEYKMYEDKLANDSLARHFGDIALSMEDLADIASFIVSSDSLGGIKDAMSAFGDLETISANMEDALKEIQKVDWKVSIGMKLSEDEQESYKQAIETYAQQAQAYAEQSRYAVALNLKIGLGDTPGADNIASKVDAFYSEQYDELSALGTKLNEAVTEAFNDGLLDIDEIPVITSIQEQMAEIEQSLATSSFDAQLSMLGMDYAGGGNLDADSFQNLQEELAKQVETATQTYKESYAKNYASIEAAHKAGDLTDTEYTDALSGIKNTYLNNIGDAQAKALNFQIETIMNQYANELDPAIKDYLSSVDDTIEEYTSNGYGDWTERPAILWEAMIQDLSNNDLDKTTRDAISKLLKALQPSVEELQNLQNQYDDIADIPESLKESMDEGLNKTNILGAMADKDQDSIFGVIGQQIKGSEYESFYNTIIEALNESDSWVPDDVVTGMATSAAKSISENAKESIKPSIEGIYAYSEDYLKETFKKDLEARANVSILMNPYIKNYVPSNSGTLPGHANGGIFTKPHIAAFAEKGAEAAIPIDGSENAISLWEKTGKLLGLGNRFDNLNLSGGGETNIQYSPQLVFQGGTPSQSDLESAMSMSQDRFESMMNQYLKKQARIAF